MPRTGFSYAIASSNAGVSWSAPFKVSNFHEPQVYASAQSGVVVSDQGTAVTTNAGVLGRKFRSRAVAAGNHGSGETVRTFTSLGRQRAP